MSFTDKSQYTEANLKKSYRNCDYFCDEAIIYQNWPQDTMYSANPSNFYLSTLFLIFSYIDYNLKFSVYLGFLIALI